jgi:hypothetical protein
MRKAGKQIQQTGLRSERGVALILTLAIIALVTLLVIGFSTSMRVENTASKNFNDLIKTREMAKGAIDEVVGTIREYTTRNAAPLNIINYVTFPGSVYYMDNAGVTRRKELYSVNAADPNLVLASDWITTNLNAVSVLWITGNGEFDTTPVPDPSQIKVGWLYVPQDPAQATGPNNPIIGRYAFWVDDEAAKINIDTAGQPTTPVPTPDYGYSVSNEVDVSVLLSNLNSFAPQIGNARSPNPYTTVEELKRADPGIRPNMFDANRFSLTTYSDDLNDLDVFGRQRKVLSALSNPSDLADAAGVDSAYNRLADPGLMKVYSDPALASIDPAFEKKYTKNGLKQILANIIAYQQDPLNPAPPDDGNEPPLYLGLGRTPYINEVQVKYQDDGAGNVTRIITVELFYLYGSDGSYTPGPDTIEVKGLPTFGVFAASPITVIVPVADVFDGTTRYRTYTIPETQPFSLPLDPGTPTIVVNYKRGANRLDCSQLVLPATTQLVNPSDGSWHGAQVNDPCVNSVPTDWIGYVAPNGTLGLPNSVYVLPAGEPDPHSKARMRGNKMQSVGELGYIHRPESWKYLKLQPGGGASAGQIPDWAILDLFTVGNTVPNVTKGRINVNSLINPGLVPAAPATQRLVPLEALLNSIITPPNMVAANIYLDDNTVRGQDTYGMYENGGNEGIFDTIGEVCEIPLLATGANEAAKEAAIRRIGNLITVRSNAFTIWVIAQSLKQPTARGAIPIGQFDPTLDLITGEVRAQAVVERYEQGGLVKFRTKYFRYL